MKTFFISLCFTLVNLSTVNIWFYELKFNISQYKIDPNFEELSKEIVNKLVKEDFEGVRENFNQQMMQGLSAEKIEEVWASVIFSLGSFQKQFPPQTKKVASFTQVTIPCQFETGNANVEVTFNKEGKVTGLYVRPA